LNKSIKDLEAGCPVYNQLDDVRKSVLVEMVFNMDFPRVMGFRSMLDCLAKEDWKGAAKAGLDSKWAEEVHGRAQDMMFVLETGAYGSNS
jgi:lysozyme